MVVGWGEGGGEEEALSSPLRTHDFPKGTNSIISFSDGVGEDFVINTRKRMSE
jgi:hypothetical protein